MFVPIGDMSFEGCGEPIRAPALRVRGEDPEGVRAGHFATRLEEVIDPCLETPATRIVATGGMTIGRGIDDEPGVTPPSATLAEHERHRIIHDPSDWMRGQFRRVRVSPCGLNGGSGRVDMGDARTGRGADQGQQACMSEQVEDFRRAARCRVRPRGDRLTEPLSVREMFGKETNLTPWPKLRVHHDSLACHLGHRTLGPASFSCCPAPTGAVDDRAGPPPGCPTWSVGHRRRSVDNQVAECLKSASIAAIEQPVFIRVVHALMMSPGTPSRAAVPGDECGRPLLTQFLPGEKPTTLC